MIEILLELANIFSSNTSKREQKHAKVRERCVAYFGYMIFGIDYLDVVEEIPIIPGAKTSDVDRIKNSGGDSKEPETEPEHQKTFKISAEMKRGYLIENKHPFFGYFNNAVKNAVDDAAEEVRNVTYKIFQKLEKHTDL